MPRTVIAAALARSWPRARPYRRIRSRSARSCSPATGRYVPQEVTLNTITDIIGHGRAPSPKLIGGARIVLDSEDPELQAPPTEEAFANAMIKNEGQARQGQLDRAGRRAVAGGLPHLEHGHRLLQPREGLRVLPARWATSPWRTSASPPPSTTSPSFILKDSNPEPLRDNALCFAPMQSFMVLPFDELQKAPLAINAGIMAHEYSHMIFNLKVYGSRRLPPPLADVGRVRRQPGRQPPQGPGRGPGGLPRLRHHL